ncbi:hypothetical protein HBH53_149790 [Parastagonospora nodorum]|nr:hypothetical protein HBH53_149790 [Parastagonospora nodorum]KAH3966924.1 hypothetical protein HBH51_141200 [Parastagonospora nodorum]KAH4027010.1 hypothetical protein HBI09_147020 [Parastagonospora nodorum]KAH4118377.1 hypothetical protein HBH47_141750 [Parastagonospora nodorum]KAH4162639.1 hypothetical protein HBH43_162290 [Parastagonospora nodorum]
MPDASTVTTRPTTSEFASPEMDTSKATRTAQDMPSLVAKESATLDLTAPSSPLPLAPPREPVTYRSTATQIKPPQTGAEFVQIYGYEPKMYDIEHKIGLAAIGRYKHPDDIPYGVIHGVPFQPAHSERNPSYNSSGFQIMALGARNMAVAKAKAKAGFTAIKYKNALAKGGEKILTQSKDEEIVHSEQYPSIINVNKDGTAQPGQDLTGRCFWNVFRADIECDDAVKCQQPTVPQVFAARLPQSMLHTHRDAKLRAIPSLEPSSQYDLPDPIVQQDFAGYEYMQEEDLPYAADTDAFVVFKAEHHVSCDSPHEPLSTPVRSRKRKDSSQLSNERDSKRSRLIAPSMSISLGEKHDISARLDKTPPKNPELAPSLPSPTPAALPMKDHLSQERLDAHSHPFPSTREDRRTDAGPRSSSRLIDASRTEHRESKSRGDRTRARSRSPTHGDIEVPGSRKYRDRKDIKGALEATTSLDKRHTEDVRSQAVQLTPTPTTQGYNNEMDLSDSLTSSSPPSSRSTLASSYGSNKSTPTCEPHDEQPAQSALATSNSVAANTTNTGSPAPLRRVRRDTVKKHAPQMQQDSTMPQASGAVEQDVGKTHESAAELTQPEQHSPLKAQEQEPQPSKKRALGDVDTDPSEVLQDQQRSKRPKKQINARKQEPEENLDGEKVVEQRDKTLQEGAEASTPSNNAEASKKDEPPAEHTKPSTEQQKRTAQSVVESTKAEIKTEDVKEKVKTDEAKPEMSDTQKKLAARRAMRAAKADGRPYVPPARRINAAGNAPTANQNRVVGNRQHRR